MNALKVQGGGEAFARISSRLGLLGWYEAEARKLLGIATVSGLEGAELEDCRFGCWSSSTPEKETSEKLNS